MEHNPSGTPSSIGRYTVVELVGRGAMGDVYAAVDNEMGRPVAIKLMRTPPEVRADARERFLREARLTGQVNHPNVVMVFDLGEDQGRPFIVMELLDAVPLAAHRQLPEAQSLDDRLDLMLQICDGLQAAHDRGVVHRDVKPSNVLVQPGGTVKLLDFGIASAAGSDIAAGGGVAFAPEYASPEQVKGEPADRRSDVFSAAAVCYFILTGRPPFGRSDLRQTIDAVLNAQPAALTPAEAPEALGRTLMKALDKNPDQRHQGVAHLRAEIEQVRRSLEGDRHRVSRAALERYRQIEALIDQRRALGRRLGLAAVERECDRTSAQLAAGFPELARAGADRSAIAPMDAALASAALARLLDLHNAVLAEVSVLQAASGERR